MRRSIWFQFLFVFMFVASPSQAFATIPTDTEVAEGTRVRVSQTYGKLPLRFEINDGQMDEQINFLSRGAGYSMFLTPTEAVMVLSRAKEQAKTNDDLLSTKTEVPKYESSTLRMQLVDSNPMPLVIPEDRQQGKTNYLKGNDPQQWRANVTNYSKVKYRQVYPGIDLVYYGNQRKLEYDFVVSPGSDYKTIQMNFAGAEKIDLDETGNLVLSTPTGNVVQQAPIVYQVVNGERKLIEGHYVLQAENRVGFQVAHYDAEKPLVIDPVLEYSTYLGGSAFDSGYGIAIDGSGNAYVTGSAGSADFPTLNAIQGAFAGPFNDVFVTKLDTSGAMIFSTYLGGSNTDSGYGIAADVSGNIYVTGETNSTDFPILNAIQANNGGTSIFSTDAFVTKLDTSGAMVYSTYLGGNKRETGYGIATDGFGNAYVTGVTLSTDFPTLNAIQSDLVEGIFFDFDIFVSKLDATGTLVYSTYLGGNAIDIGLGIAADDSGKAYLTGRTGSTDFPSVNAIQGDQTSEDVFVTKLDTSGAMVYSTYLGGSEFEEGRGIATDGSGNAYLTGSTSSTDFPTLNAIQDTRVGSSDIFVTKLDALGAMVYSTYLGEDGDIGELGGGIAADGFGNAYVTGSTPSIDFPTVNPTQGAHAGGAKDVFVAKLSASGALVFSTYLGGSDSDTGNGIAVDTSGNAYVTGNTSSTDFPTLNAIQGTLAGSGDAFVTKISIPLPAPTIARNDFDGDGDSDLLLVHDTGFVFAVTLENSVFQSFGFLLQADPAQGWQVHATGDFNSDKKSDVFLYNSTTGEYRVVLMDGLTVISDTVVLTLDPAFGLEPRGVGDFNGDGFAEIVVYQPASGFTALIYLNGGGFASFEIVTQIDEVNNVTLKDTGDFNQDGKTDLLTYNTVTGETAVIEMDGSTPLATTSIFTLAPATGLTVEDNGEFDGNGKTDIAVLHSSGALGVFTLNGIAYQGFYVPGNLPTDFVLVNTGRYDGDNKSDFLIYNATTGELRTAIQDGATITSFNSVLNLGPASGWSYHKGKP